MPPAKNKTKTATVADVCRWLKEGVFRVEDGRVFKGEKELAQRLNTRRNSERGDFRVDLFHEGKRRACHVSQLTWMQETGIPIPAGFEIHHDDEDPTNNDFDNLICVHSLDHLKLHRVAAEYDDTPF